MSIRDWIYKNPAWSVVILSLVLIGGISFVVRSGGTSPSARAARATSAYFSDDDGQTFFADSIDQIPPFSHDGKQAYRAAIFKCANGGPFVGFLERYTDAARAKIEKLQLDPKQNEIALQDAMNSGIEVKKPGDLKWVPRQSSAGAAATALPKCPDGGKVVGLAP